MRFPRVERYRADIQKKAFRRLSNSEASELRNFYHSHEFNLSLGGGLSPETFAFLDMLISEKVPPDVSTPVILQYVCEELVLRNNVISSQQMH